MSGWVAELEAENQALRDRIEVLERDRGLDWCAPNGWGLTRMQERIFGILLRREQVSKNQFMDALYGHLRDEPDSNVVNVTICGLRQNLRPHGIVIETLGMRGWRISPESKAGVRELVGEVSDGQ